MRKVLLLLVAFVATISCTKNEYTQNESLYGAELNLADVNMDYETALEILKNNTNVRIMTNDGFEAVCDTLIWTIDEGDVFVEEGEEHPEFYMSADRTVSVVVTDSALSIAAYNNAAEESGSEEDVEGINTFFITNDEDEISSSMAMYQMTRSAAGADAKGSIARLSSRVVRIVSDGSPIGEHDHEEAQESMSYVSQSAINEENIGSSEINLETRFKLTSVNIHIHNATGWGYSMVKHLLYQDIASARTMLCWTTLCSKGMAVFNFHVTEPSFSFSSNDSVAELARYKEWLSKNGGERYGRDIFVAVRYWAFGLYGGRASVNAYTHGRTDNYNASGIATFMPGFGRTYLLSHELCHIFGGEHNTKTWWDPGAWYTLWIPIHTRDLMNESSASRRSMWTRDDYNKNIMQKSMWG